MTESSHWIIDVTIANFERDVIARSEERPVLVDFWATWCGPCTTLGPKLEAAAKKGAGSFMLAKVDIDKNPELAQAFRVQSVPTVVAIQGGRPVDGFQGDLPEAEIEAFLERVGATAGPTELSQARELAEEGKSEEAITLLRPHLNQQPDDGEARIFLAQLLIQGGEHEEGAAELGRLSEKDQASDEAKALLALLELSKDVGDLDELEGAVKAAPEDPGARTAYGKALIAAQNYEGGLEQLLEAVKLDPGHDGGAAKQAMLETFDVLGLEDPTANQFRFQLSLQLFT